MLGLFLLILKFSFSTAEIDAYLGSTATLSCSSGNSFQWYKFFSSTEIKQLIDGGRYTGVTSQNLQINWVEAGDGGWYRCYYFPNSGGSGSIDVKLNVKDPWYPWSPWSSCSVTCGRGTQSRSRTCMSSGCTGNAAETLNCNTGACPDLWYPWSPWSSCSVTCGSGTQTRSRSCASSGCTGNADENQSCNTQACPVLGQWSNWDQCNTGCGERIITRYRTCNYYGQPAVDPSLCRGSTSDRMPCLISPCTVDRHRKVIIDCQFIDGVYWEKEENVGFLRNSTKYTGLNNWQMTIQDLQYPDSGRYRCAKNDYPYGWKYGEYTTIIIQGSPSVTVGRTTYNVAVGALVVMECNVISNPIASRVWWTNVHGDIGSDSQNKYSGGTKFTPSLTIHNIQENDNGKYTCHAENIHGESSATTTVVTGNTPFVSIPKDYYVAKAKDKSVTLVCDVINGENTALSWLKNHNSRLSNSSKYIVGTLASPSRSLVIKDITNEDKGPYQCLVESLFGYGSGNDTTVLKVVDAVSYKTQYQEKANGSVTLNCIVSDAKSVIWKHNGNTIVIDNNKYSGGIVNSAPLNIVNLTRSDRGKYTCESLYDDVTVTGETITLKIIDVPFVMASNDYFQVSTGDVVILPCSYDAFPNPTEVFWKKNGNNLSTTLEKFNGSSISHPSLIIYDTSNPDAGMYICTVSNVLGTASGNKIKLEIKEPETSSSVAPVVAGGIGAALLTIIILSVVFLLFRKRRQCQSPRKPTQTFEKTIQHAKPEVEFRPGGCPSEGLYINIARNSNRKSSSDTDDDIIQVGASMLKDSTCDEKTYYNMPDEIPNIITNINVDDLKAYIERREKNDGLINEYKSIPYGAVHPTIEAQIKENMPKNRFKTTFPYDHTRVILEKLPGTAHSDYVNANYVDGFEKEKCYIASQGPLKSTFSEFWRMIWQNKCKKIVMLTNLVEGTKVKCDKYWPAGGKQMTVGNLVLTLISEKERAAYVTREISVEDKKTKEKRFVFQYHFVAWPDHGTPDPLYLILFHKHVTSDHALLDTGPLLVHCSAGIGRTGTYIGLDALEEEGRATGYVDVVKYVKKMRYARMNMVQTQEQYVCLHKALLEAFTMMDTNISKEQYGDVWKEIQSDRRPINQQRLHEEYKMLETKKAEHAKAEYTAAKSTSNINKNQNKNVLPSDGARLYLVSFEKGRTDYINAVQVPSYTQFVGYITTQLPVEDTKGDFWTMVKDHSSSTIVLILNEEQEADMVYSSSDANYSRGSYSFKVTKHEKRDYGVTETTIIMSRKDDKPKEIGIFQAVCRSTPDSKLLSHLINLIATRISLTHDPVTVVSSDGAKNCGLFCLFANAVSSMNIDNKVNIFQLARLLQLRRPEFFDDFKEYKMCYEAMYFHLESSNVYANF